MSAKPVKILAISGSLRKRSYHTAVLRAVGSLAGEGVSYTISNRLDRLPPFNPDVDADRSFDSVEDLRKQVRKADGVMISTPEYARGVPGVLKNALDWIVSSGDLVNKPVAVISASPALTGGDYARESLLITLGMMDAIIVEGGVMRIPLVGTKFNAEKGVTDRETEKELRSVLHALLRGIHSQ